MDIYCPKCAEPWDMDELHEAVAADYYPTFTEARKAFARYGCPAMDGRAKACPDTVIGHDMGNLISEVYDLLGDDLDGAASMLEDARLMGLI